MVVRLLGASFFVIIHVLIQHKYKVRHYVCKVKPYGFQKNLHPLIVGSYFFEKPCIHSSIRTLYCFCNGQQNGY